ncbi:hypothetical protein ACWEWG_19725 [Streptomyces sp. NPDC003758]|uniref:Uncharacterized protein n=1 Tax=Streptomyces cynarae TaxID=2981134 RepID=A0ABY6DVW9_9ACTN|nr:hypothetical protein [Streptomyces cynarae]UXY18522.1 hypothetical protein N8I84_07130 [Streptomyces cynarae]
MAEMFVPADHDPRVRGPATGDERTLPADPLAGRRAIRPSSP